MDCRGEEMMGGSGSTRDSRTSFHDWRSDCVQQGDPYVTAVVERFGVRYEAEVPLVWGEEST